MSFSYYYIYFMNYVFFMTPIWNTKLNALNKQLFFKYKTKIYIKYVKIILLLLLLLGVKGTKVFLPQATNGHIVLYIIPG